MSSGEVGIDHDLLIASEQRIVELSNGCLCCDLGGDFARSLYVLAERRDEFDTLIVELSGLSEPAPVLEMLHAGAELRNCFRMRGVLADEISS